MTEINIPTEEQANSFNKPNPFLLTSMVVSVKQIKEDMPEKHDEEIIYLTVKQYLISAKFNIRQDLLVGTIFAYYLDVYRGFMATRSDVAPSSHLHPDAALSLFTLYKYWPNDPIVRQLVQFSADAIHEVITLQQSSSDKPMRQLLSHLSNIALLTQTVSSYVKGTKRRKSYAYIAWLKTFLSKALVNDDLSFIDNDEEVKNVIKQVSLKAPFITLEG